MAVCSAGNLISHVAVVGDGRRYNVALIVADPARAGEPDLHEKIREQVDRANATLARVEQIEKFTVLERGRRQGHELTPTMLRRRVIDEIYSAEIGSCSPDPLSPPITPLGVCRGPPVCQKVDVGQEELTSHDAGEGDQPDR